MITLLLIIFTGQAWANCLGCCNAHGGVVCVDGVTRCQDGTAMSERCLSKEKACNKCEVLESSSAYNRKDWMPRGWVDKDHDCQTTRVEVLARDNREEMGSRSCKIKKGLWQDYYAPDNYIQDASKTDIDHVLSLKEAHDYGGAAWPKEKKQIYAQDMDNLVVTGFHMNREKGSQSPATWLPSIDKQTACKYLLKWQSIATKYKLNPPAIVLKQVDYTLKHCEN